MRTSLAAVTALAGSMLLAPLMMGPTQAQSAPDLKNAVTKISPVTLVGGHMGGGGFGGGGGHMGGGGFGGHMGGFSSHMGGMGGGHTRLFRPLPPFVGAADGSATLVPVAVVYVFPANADPLPSAFCLQSPRLLR